MKSSAVSRRILTIMLEVVHLSFGLGNSCGVSDIQFSSSPRTANVRKRHVDNKHYCSDIRIKNINDILSCMAEHNMALINEFFDVEQCFML